MFVVGWLTTLGWQAFVASGAYLCGTMIQGLIVLVNPNYAPAGWHATLLLWAVTLFCVSINTIVSGLLPKFEAVILFLHILGFFAILIPLVVLGPHGDPQDVFNSFYNGGEWPTQGLSFFVGLIGNVFAFFGADGAIHVHNLCLPCDESS
jgi:choline transport protein